MKRLSIIGILSAILGAIMLGGYYPMFARVAGVVVAMIVVIVVSGILLLFCCKDEEDDL